MAIILASQAVDFQKCITKMTNGCSIPLNLPFPYKDIFLPACERHDICYECGKMYNWTRNQCDVSFQKNMLTLCQLKEDFKNGKQTYNVSIWEKLKSVFYIASQLFKWISIKSGTLDHCNHGAKVYYSSVDKFAHPNYGSGDPILCQLQCANLLGNPKNLI